MVWTKDHQNLEIECKTDPKYIKTSTIHVQIKAECTNSSMLSTINQRLVQYMQRAINNAIYLHELLFLTRKQHQNIRR